MLNFKYLFLSLILLISSQLLAQNKSTVSINSQDIHFEENRQSIDWHPTQDEQELNKIFRLVHYYELPGSDQIDELRNRGIELVEYIPHNTYLVSINTESIDYLKNRSDIKSIIPLRADLKIHPSVLDPYSGEWAKTDDRVDIRVTFYPGISYQTIKSFSANHGLTILKKYGTRPSIAIEIPLERVAEIAGSPIVKFVNLVAPPDEKDDWKARNQHRVNLMNGDGLSYDGTGISVQVRDDGRVGPHIDYQGRLSNLTNDFSGTHGDGVGGIIAGGGNLDERNTSMAPGAYVYASGYESTFTDTTLGLHLHQNVLITNSSYSNGCNDGYVENTAEVDRQIHENPTLLHVFSAGNSGSQNCSTIPRWYNITGGHKQGKNVITTANLKVDASLTPSSSKGPATDGRIKPDLSAQGTDQISTAPDNDFLYFGGTSAAAPGIAGTCATLYDAYRDLNGELPPSALIKASLLNTANDLGNPGPDFKFGWGLINANKAFNLLQEYRYHTDMVENQEMKNLVIFVPAGVKQVRVMAYWNDPEGSIMAEKALVNDLELRLTDAEGNTHLPLVLDPTPIEASLESPAIPGVDSLNNVEQIRVNDPMPGAFQIEITGKKVPFGPQEYFLLYEYIYDDPEITFPANGVALIPGENIRIQYDSWDGRTEPISLYYSTDDAFTWTYIDTISTAKQSYVWRLPEDFSGMLQMKLEYQGNEKIYTDVATVLERPEITFTSICYENVSFEWDPAPIADSYIIYQLGNTYMDSVGITQELNYELTGLNMSYDNWIAVQPVLANGQRGLRSIAKKVSLEDKTCIAQKNLKISKAEAENGNTQMFCDQEEFSVIVPVTNDGLDTIFSFIVGLGEGSMDIHQESFSFDFAPGDTMLKVVFPFFEPEVGEYNFTIWVSHADQPLIDDTTDFKINLITGIDEPWPLKDTITFEAGLPISWQNFSPDIETAWKIEKVIGPTSDSSFCLTSIGSTNSAGNHSSVLTQTIDLDSLTKASLHFDIAHNAYFGFSHDSLQLIILPLCTPDKPDTLFNHIPDLYLPFEINLDNIPWYPHNDSEWGSMKFDLTPWCGNGKFTLMLTNTGGAYSSMFIDNIRISGDSADTFYPTIVSPETVCGDEIVTFLADNANGADELTWEFGDFATPETATGPGPIEVSFSHDGQEYQDITLNATKDSSTISLITEVSLSGPVEVDINYFFLVGKCFFSTSYGHEYYTKWTFGDDGTSSGHSPQHIYEYGVYNVTLTKKSFCEEKDTAIVVIYADPNATINISGEVSMEVFPNPASEYLYFKVDENSSHSMNYRIVDLKGQPQMSGQLLFENEFSSIDISNLSTGMFVLLIETSDGQGKKVHPVKFVKM